MSLTCSRVRVGCPDGFPLCPTCEPKNRRWNNARILNSNLSLKVLVKLSTYLEEKISLPESEMPALVKLSTYLEAKMTLPEREMPTLVKEELGVWGLYWQTSWSLRISHSRTWPHKNWVIISKNNYKKTCFIIKYQVFNWWFCFVLF